MYSLRILGDRLCRPEQLDLHLNVQPSQAIDSIADR